jgi:hypothetical protein
MLLFAYARIVTRKPGSPSKVGFKIIPSTALINILF